MFTPKCPDCKGSGMTPFRQHGGRCYTCSGSGKVTPSDVLREWRRAKAAAVLDDGRVAGALVLVESPAGDDLVWGLAYEAFEAGVPVVVPEADGWGWKVQTITRLADGVMTSAQRLAALGLEAPPF